MKIAIPSLLLFAGLTATHPATVLAVAPPAAADQGRTTRPTTISASYAIARITASTPTPPT
ncbi:hypothetical protein M5585_16185 [Serratia ureilytica]